MVYEWVEEACRAGGRLDKLVGLKWDRCVLLCVFMCVGVGGDVEMDDYRAD